jgi:hypothetical protein
MRWSAIHAAKSVGIIIGRFSFTAATRVRLPYGTPKLRGQPAADALDLGVNSPSRRRYWLEFVASCLPGLAQCILTHSLGTLTSTSLATSCVKRARLVTSLGSERTLKS